MRNVGEAIPLIPVPRQASAWQRRFEASRTLNDAVEAIHCDLMNGPESEKYFKYLDAIHDSQAVEGSLSADNFSSATIIREWARKKGNMIVAKQNLATINQSLGVVLRRYGLSRTERRNTVAGKVVPVATAE